MLFYTGISFFIILFDTAFGLRIHSGILKYQLGQLFHNAAFNTDHTYGYLGITSWVLNMPLMIAGLVFVVEKGNKILDFVSTCYFFHYLFCVIYNSQFIFTFGWYMINFSCFFATVIIGEYVCIKFE